MTTDRANWHRPHYAVNIDWDEVDRLARERDKDRQPQRQQVLAVRVPFQHHRLAGLGAARCDQTMSEWLREAVASQLRRQGLL